MMTNHDLFLEAIRNKKKVKVTVDSKEKGLIVRRCIPFDYGPSRIHKDGKYRYHFFDLDSPQGPHNLSILPEQLRNIEILDENFNPGDYVKWTPAWFIPRDWGEYS